MKKRTLVIAFVSLLATLSYLHAAGAAPIYPLPATPARAPEVLPTITEQAALVIEPTRLGELPLRLEVGDKVDGRVTVVPSDINFIVRDPNEKTILNTGMVTDNTTFTFKATTRGVHQLVFGNTLFLANNKVVLVQLQHTGAQLLPYSGGTYVAVRPAEIKTLTVELAANQAVEGTLNIEGGSRDLRFTVSGPSGSTVISPGTVYSSYSFAFTPSASGAYQLNFDNSFSAFISKLVTVEMRKNRGGQALWWGTATRLAFTTSPTGATAGSVFATQPVVTVQDDNGNTAATSSAAITVTITSGRGASGAILSGATTVNAVNGVATFSSLGINLAGSGYTLTATASGLTAAASAVLDVAPPPPVDYVALNAGWNLVSLPLVPKNTAIASVISGISGSVISVWHYDAASASWQNYVPAIGGTLATMTDGNAYWVNMSAPATLTIDGSELPASPAARPAYPVVPGWNMVGLKSTIPIGAVDYLNGTSYRLFPAYGYARGAYSTLNPAVDSLQPGLGYWVYFYGPGAIKP